MKSIVTTLTLIFTAALLATPAYAGGCDKKKGCSKSASVKRKAEREARRELISAYLEDKDKNNDGSLSEEEFISTEENKGAARRLFDEANTNGDRYLSKNEIYAMLKG